MQLGLFSCAVWTNLFCGLIELDPSFYIPKCTGMSPALPVSTSSAYTADLWQPPEEQQHSRCHFGWPQKLGKEPCKAGSLTKLNSRSHKARVVLLAERDGYTWPQLCSGEQRAGRAFVSRLVPPHWVTVCAQHHPQGSDPEPGHCTDWLSATSSSG